jgi:hypothetical protein
MPDALAYRLVDDERYSCARVVWDGASRHTANDLVRPRVDEEEAPALAEAVRVLEEILSDGPLAAGNIKKMAAQAGVTERTLHRARQALGVTTMWAMPADPPDPMARGTHGTHGMDAEDAKDAKLEDMGEHGRLPYPDDDPDDDPRRFTR